MTVTNTTDLPAVEQPAMPADQPSWNSFDDATLATMTFAMAQTLAERERRYHLETEAMREEFDEMRTALMRRIRNSGGYALPHENLRVEIDQKFVPQKRINTLRKLEGLLPDDELRPALCLVHSEPVWRADGHKLRALARKYGGKIAEIIHDGMPHVPTGPPRLILEPKSVIRTAIPAPPDYTAQR